jgi:subtilase family serine protease
MSITLLQRSLALLTVVAAVAGVASAAQPPLPAPAMAHSAPVCPRSGNGADCHARVVTDGRGQPLASTAPAGYGRSQFQTAYNLPASAPAGTTIAIVDAYDHPNIQSDLNTYSNAYGYPTLPACSAVASGTPCFKKVNQRGGTTYPAANAGWALETSLDVEVAHATCPNCSIVLVEADSNSFANLMAAVDQAVAQGAKVVSNSYGGSEFSGETSYDYHFNHPGVAFTVSSGDNGYGVEYPAASQYVTAVGGTTLRLSSNLTRSSETAWSGAGSGCSAYEPKPAFQADSCARRTVADVSAVADPNTGAAVYDSVRYQGRKGWYVVGGTSLAAPLVAATYALGGVAPGVQANSLPYGHTANLFDITSGTNGSCGTYLCSATGGYDGPTGLGTPNGALAF